MAQEHLGQGIGGGVEGFGGVLEEFDQLRHAFAGGPRVGVEDPVEMGKGRALRMAQRLPQGDGVAHAVEQVILGIERLGREGVCVGHRVAFDSGRRGARGAARAAVVFRRFRTICGICPVGAGLGACGAIHRSG